jgi:hypothetical protein
MSFHFRTKKNFHLYVFLYLVMVSLIDLESYKEEIIALYKDELTQIIAKTLKEKHEIQISDRTIKKRLQK